MWYLICSYVGGSILCGLVSLTSSSYPSPCSAYSSELIGGGFLGPHPHPHPATYKSIDIPPIQLNNSTQSDDEISTSPRGLGIRII